MRFRQADLNGLDPAEVTYRLTLALAAAAKAGLKVRDSGISNWGFDFRSGRMVLLISDGSSWVQLQPTDASYGKFPSQRFIASFWPFVASVYATAAQDVGNIVYHRQEDSGREAERIFNTIALLSGLARLNSPQTWNPFR